MKQIHNKPQRLKRAENTAPPEGFSLAMALADCLPILFFSISSSVLAVRFASMLFRTGIFLVILAGAMKAGWKFVIALAGKDVSLLNRQMRFLMPSGFLLILLSLFADRERWSAAAILRHMISLPSLLFFLAGAAGILRLCHLARHLDGRDAKANWNEQLTNGITQLCILLGILF